MRGAALAFFVAGVSPAAAHPGHLADLAGHSHWAGLAALTAAAAVAAALKLKDRKAKKKSDAKAPAPEKAAA